MKIEWTESAIQKIKEKINNQSGYLKMKYMTEGCGCVMSGVTALWLVNDLETEDEKVETNLIPVYVEGSKVIFLDDVMKIDFVAEVNSFQLKSPNGMLNPRMPFVNQTV